MGYSLNANVRMLFNNVLRGPALAYRDMRLLCLSAVFNSTGFMGENVALGWVVLQLTDSPFMVGAAFGVRLAPSFFFGLVAGAIADNVDRRILMRALDVCIASASASLGLLIFFDVVQVWHLFVLSFISGSMYTTYHTLRQSFAYDIVGPANVVNGLALVSLGVRSGGIIGSLAVGFLLDAYGADMAYFMLSASYVFSAIALMFIHSRGQAAPVARQPVLRNSFDKLTTGLREFGAEIRRNNTLLTLTILTGAVEVLGFSHQALLPSIARDTLGVGSEG
ncbi:MAG: MFS transporter, partial [Ardenticatenaceae bacterium]